MPIARGAIPRLLGRAVLVAAPVGNALGDVLRDVEETIPALFPANLPDPQLQLVNTIALLFAGSLGLLVCGYVFESDNFSTHESDSPPSSPGPSGASPFETSDF